MLIFEIMDKKNIPQFSVLPKHIGIIMDGNGRWAKQRNLPRYKGHIEGAKTFCRIGEFAADVGVKCLTFYAFSTENWKRPQEEVDAIMQLFREYLIEADERTEENKEKGITLRFIGDRTGIPEDIQALMEHIENVSKYETKVVLNLAVNYGGRHEITQGVQAIAQKVANGELSPEDITEEIKPSYEDQIEIIAQKADEWFGIDVNTSYSYCVTDLDANGRLEIISSGIGGSGQFSFGNIYEVNSTFDGLDKCGENGSFHPDITLKDEIFCRIDPETGKIYYEVYDYMR